MGQIGNDGVAGVLHVGFGRPPARAFNEAAGDNEGRLLVTQGARFVLPEPYRCSGANVAEVDGLPIFLALEGWGYSIEDPTLSSISQPGEGNTRDAANDLTQMPATRGWVSQFLAVAPEFDEALKQAGVHDEESYVEQEAMLQASVRTAVGQFRYDFLIRDASDPLDIVRCAPPWLRSQELEKLPLTVRLRNVFNMYETKLVADLDKYSRETLLKTKNFGRGSYSDLARALQEGLRRGAIDLETPPDDFGAGLTHPGSKDAPRGEVGAPFTAISLGLMGIFSRRLMRSRNEIANSSWSDGIQRSSKDSRGSCWRLRSDPRTDPANRETIARTDNSERTLGRCDAPSFECDPGCARGTIATLRIGGRR